MPSFSREEMHTATLLEDFLKDRGYPVERILHNIIVKNKNFNPDKKTVLLNSHHDTVRPVSSWQRDPFDAVVEENRLYGLGSNDAGGSVISLMDAFFEFYDREDLNRNLILVISAEEEISGANGIASVLKEIKDIDFGLVGEPTGMKMGIAEKGLMVLDCKANGKAGHAARNEGDNAIYRAIDDLAWFRNFRFPRISRILGPVKMSVTLINAGTQHNMVPDVCDFTVDLRSTDAYTHDEILEIIRANVSCEVVPRSTRLKPSGLPEGHILAEAGRKLGLELFGSDALSDQALMNFPTVKIGPGDGLRSHMADEFITLDEIKSGMKIYIGLLNEMLT